MKEKTFVDLIQKERESIPDFQGLDSATVLQLLQQVREATIAEVSQIAKEDFGIGSGRPFIKHIKSLPTDRIRIEP